MGIVASDFDFLAEPLEGSNSQVRVQSGTVYQPQEPHPRVDSNNEFTGFFGAPGELIALTDGNESDFDIIDLKFRTYRGGSAFVLSAPFPGGPVTWSAGSIRKATKPFIMGGVLVGKALLVRNFPEEVPFNAANLSEGGEIQMVIVTYACFGPGPFDPANALAEMRLNGTLCPTGFGEGYAAADRYLIHGRPLVRGRRTTQDPSTVTLCTFPEAGGPPIVTCG